MMTLQKMPPGDMFSCAAILVVVGPGLTGASTTMEVKVLAVLGG